MTTTGTIFDLKRYSVQDGPGIRTTVFLKGCPLNCVWCHNPESQDRELTVLYRPQLCIDCGACVTACRAGALSPAIKGVTLDQARCTRCGDCAKACPSGALTMVGRRISAEELVREISRDSTFFDESNGGVTFSGGEPLAQPAFLSELLDRCGELGIHRTVDTSGYADAETLADIAKRTDLFLVDVKLLDSGEHKRWAGVPNETILRNIRWLSESGYPMKIRMPIIPGITDTPANLEAARDFIASLPNRPVVRLLPHHRAAMAKYERFGIARRMPETAEPTSEQVELIAERMREAGLIVKTSQSLKASEDAL
jgi:pyruvate formate lyase activating enzyme